jgi:hypothetical protein
MRFSATAAGAGARADERERGVGAQVHHVLIAAGAAGRPGAVFLSGMLFDVNRVASALPTASPRVSEGVDASELTTLIAAGTVNDDESATGFEYGKQLV